MEIIRAESPDDVALIARLADTIWREHYTPIIGKGQVDYMMEQFQSPEAISHQMGNGQTYELLFNNREAIGYIAYEPRGKDLFLSKYYVHKSHRGLGFGKLAMGHIIDCGKALGCTQIKLTVNKDNINSIAAYKAMGFQIAGPIVQDIGRGYVMDDYEMALVL
jgi:RimJ/RimL family protein N-acetyltransferase